MSNNIKDDGTKRPNVKSKYDQQKIDELANCLDDPIYFMRNFMVVQHPKKGRVPFDLYDYQEEMVEVLKDNRYSILLTGRQLGKTITAAAYLLWYAMFVPDATILIVANKGDQALEIMDRIRFAYKELPEHIKAGVEEFNKGSLVFDNGSRIISRATSADSGRGLSVTLLYCLGGENTVTIRDKITGEIKEVELKELYDELETNNI